jgi:hypothetical protein
MLNVIVLNVVMLMSWRLLQCLTNLTGDEQGICDTLICQFLVVVVVAVVEKAKAKVAVEVVAEPTST